MAKCYINSLPGILVSDNTATSPNCSNVINTSTNIDAAGISDSNTASKVYADPNGDINVAIEGPISITELGDPMNQGLAYGVYISKENAREKVTLFRNINYGQGYSEDAPKVENPIIFSELDSNDNSLAYVYLRISHKQLMLARGTYVVRIYKAKTPDKNDFEVLRVFTLTVKSDPIQGLEINKAYTDSANRLYYRPGGYSSYIDAAYNGTTNGSGGDDPSGESIKADKDAGNLSQQNVEQWRDKLDVESVESSTYTDNAGTTTSYTKVGDDNSISEISGNVVRSANINATETAIITLPKAPRIFTVSVEANGILSKFFVTNDSAYKEIISGGDSFNIIAYDNTSGDLTIQNTTNSVASVTVSYQI